VCNGLALGPRKGGQVHVGTGWIMGHNENNASIAGYVHGLQRHKELSALHAENVKSC